MASRGDRWVDTGDSGSPGKGAVRRARHAFFTQRGSLVTYPDGSPTQNPPLPRTRSILPGALRARFRKGPNGKQRVLLHSARPSSHEDESQSVTIAGKRVIAQDSAIQRHVLRLLARINQKGAPRNGRP